MLLTLYFNNGLFHVIEKSWAIGWYGVHTSKKSVTIKSSPFTGIFRVTGKLDNIIKIIITAVTINAWTSQQQQKTIYLFFLGGKTRTEAYTPSSWPGSTIRSFGSSPPISGRLSWIIGPKGQILWFFGWKLGFFGI